MNDSGLAIRNMNDSTLYCDPRNMTEAKSTPNTRANSLYVSLTVVTAQIDGSETYAFLVMISAASTTSMSMTTRWKKYFNTLEVCSGVLDFQSAVSPAEE